MKPFLYHPTVFCVKDEYQIIFITENPGMAWVEAGRQKFVDAETGLMRWNDVVHRVTVPAAVVNEAKGYAVCYQEMADRAPYYPKHENTVRREYAFYPLTGQYPLNICYLADTHGCKDEPAACAAQKDFDLLIAGGDIADHNSTREDLWVLLDICGRAAKGEKPVIFSRGNHDTRGPMASYLPSMIGMDGGNTYYTVEQPGLLALVLDAGEDKPDKGIEYGDTICFEPFRRRETEWLEQVKSSGKWKDAPLRVAICHIPFCMQQGEVGCVFDIEAEVYSRWTGLLNDMGVELLIAGHMHVLHVLRPGDEHLKFDAAFTTLIGSERPQNYVGAHYEITETETRVTFVRADGSVCGADIIRRN